MTMINVAIACLLLNFIIAIGQTSKTINIKPSIHFDDLELKLLCNPRELRREFTKKIRIKWTKCLGLGRIYFPSGNDVNKMRNNNNLRRNNRRIRRLSTSTLDENTWKRLRLFLTTSDDTMNVYCRLASNWKPCSYHLKNIHCIQSNHDAIQMAKNPKYSPLYHNLNRQQTQSMQQKLSSKRQLIISAEREDNIENMAELYRIRCENIRMSAHYMNGGSRSESATLFNRYNQHLFEDYNYPDEEDDDLYDSNNDYDDLDYRYREEL